MPDEPNNECNIIIELGDALRGVIETYATGNDIPVELIVGLLHCIAHEVIEEQYIFEPTDEDLEDKDGWYDDFK
jgi:hypothetical protein